MENSRSKPLTGRVVLVTRAQRAGDELVSELAAYGARVLYCPTIEIVAPSDNYQGLDQALTALSQYQCLLFTSKNSVDALIGRLEKLAIDRGALAGVKILAVGAATAAALARAGIEVTIVPIDYRAEGALVSLQQYYQQELSRCRFLFPRAAQGRELLVAELTRLGARVDLVEAYQTSAPAGAGAELARLLATESIDLITFTSPSTIANLAEMMMPTSLTELLAGIAIGCIGPVTANAARDYGLLPAVMPEQSTAIELARAIKDFLAKR